MKAGKNKGYKLQERNSDDSSTTLQRKIVGIGGVKAEEEAGSFQSSEAPGLGRMVSAAACHCCLLLASAFKSKAPKSDKHFLLFKEQICCRLYARQSLTVH